ncbi:ABC transporter substrate-binding protein [Porphyrobacter sp. CACIAM 03H1]|uniref:ABC transporter substrate-binding protein n=1 Tax=Porphyrobacter sp. CACIAM 03H1 TaxID=2003315 RepID=UPI000B5AAC39|nr:ABC transporter substrate-binding protein [Porphyrobacter sp. CACIAM 03H1]ASJ90633.1 cobalamin-binding protein [Porphyrobacter sp. CACIAM 03H1]
MNPPIRIVSLLPSATEIAVALGLQENLVGRSHECDFPPAVKALPVCTSTKLEKGLTSQAIEDRVKAIVEKGLSVYDVDAALLKSLKPDVILTQAQCAVCAVTPADLEEALASWVGTPPVLVSLAPDDLADVFGDLQRVAEAAGVPERAAEAAARMREGFGALPAAPAVRPTMLAVEWIQPLMVAGNWVPELVTAAGAEPLLAAPGVHSHWIDTQAVVAADPDIIVLMPCGYQLAQTLPEARALLAGEPWRSLRAVREGRVYAVDGHHLFNRPGPRLVESAEVLACLIHTPDAVPDHLAPFIARL